MEIETQRLLIRDVKTEDEISFVKMAADGSLNDCGFDRDCGNWITKWIDEARCFAFRDNPNTDYLAYTITLLPFRNCISTGNELINIHCRKQASTL